MSLKCSFLYLKKSLKKTDLALGPTEKEGKKLPSAVYEHGSITVDKWEVLKIICYNIHQHNICSTCRGTQILFTQDFCLL